MPGEYDFLLTELADHKESLEKYQLSYDATSMTREEFERTGGYDATLIRQQDQLFSHLSRERARIQELTGMIAQHDQRREANAILSEVKAHTSATVNAVKQGEKQARLMTAMTVLILVGTAAIAWLTWEIVQHEKRPVEPIIIVSPTKDAPPDRTQR